MDREAQRGAACCELVADVASLAGEVRLKVWGSSMLPAIWPGDVVTARRSDIGDLKPGDLVLYRRDAGLVVHRIKRISSDFLITRGDSVPSDDPPVRMPEVLGRVVAIERRDRPVSINQSCWQRGVALLLRRSDLCLRLLLGVRARLCRWKGLELPVCPYPRPTGPEPRI